MRRCEGPEAATNRLIRSLTGGRQVPVNKNLWFIRKAPEIWLINIFDLVRPPLPDILVHIKVPADRVMERMRSGGARQGPFDNVPFLERLDDAYRRLGEGYRKRHRVQVLELEGAEAEPTAVADRIEEICRRNAEQAETG